MSLLALKDDEDPGCLAVPVPLADLDRELLEAVPGDERKLAERMVVATRHRLPAGAWSPQSLLRDGSPQPHAILLLKGIIVRDVVLAGRASGHLFGPGDILRPWRTVQTSFSSSTCWTCNAGGAEIAVLEDRFARAAWKWPGISAVIQERLAEQLDTSALRTAIVSLPRAEQRILALLWQFADRWGTVTPAGVVVPVELTHELIGRLIGARRPTVTLALQTLVDEGTLTRTGTGTWCLSHGSHMELDRRTAALAS